MKKVLQTLKYLGLNGFIIALIYFGYECEITGASAMVTFIITVCFLVSLFSVFVVVGNSKNEKMMITFLPSLKNRTPGIIRKPTEFLIIMALAYYGHAVLAWLVLLEVTCGMIIYSSIEDWDRVNLESEEN